MNEKLEQSKESLKLDTLVRKYLNEGKTEADFNNIYKQVTGLIKHFVVKSKNSDYDDLVQEGGIAIYEALSTYDLSREIPFSYWASVYIRKRINRYSQVFKVIRIPVNLISVLKDIRDLKDLKEVKSIHKSVNEKIIDDLYNYHFGGSSSSFFYTDSEEGLAEIEIPSNLNSDDVIIRKLSKKDLIDISRKVLTKTEFKIVYGVEFELKTLEEVGFGVNLTRERVRQIKNNSVEKLKSYMNKKEICYNDF